jgi:hypothetical protein
MPTEAPMVGLEAGLLLRVGEPEREGTPRHSGSVVRAQTTKGRLGRRYASALTPIQIQASPGPP